MLFARRRRDHRCCLGAIEGDGATMEAQTCLGHDVQGSSLLPGLDAEAEIRDLDGGFGRYPLEAAIERYRVVG
jgi:hypothetical protein